MQRGGVLQTIGSDCRWCAAVIAGHSASQDTIRVPVVGLARDKDIFSGQFGGNTWKDCQAEQLLIRQKAHQELIENLKNFS